MNRRTNGPARAPAGDLVLAACLLALGAAAGCAADDTQLVRICGPARDSGGEAVTTSNGGSACVCPGNTKVGPNDSCPAPNIGQPLPPGQMPEMDPKLEPIVSSYQRAQQTAGVVEDSLFKADQHASDGSAVVGMAATAAEEDDGAGDPESDLTMDPPGGNLADAGIGAFNTPQRGHGGGGGGRSGITPPDGLQPAGGQSGSGDGLGEGVDGAEGGGGPDGAGEDGARYAGGGKASGENGGRSGGNEAISLSASAGGIVDFGGGGGGQAPGNAHAEDQGARTEVPPMAGEDPEDYFTRIAPGRSLFQIVEERYRAETADWQ